MSALRQATSRFDRQVDFRRSMVECPDWLTPQFSADVVLR
jgi:hypothetical protein